MKITLIALVAALCATFSQHVRAQARIFTVDNKPGAVAMYSNLQDAYVEANNGDTIILAASPVEYGEPVHHNGDNIRVYKRINYVGSGYLIAENSIPSVIRESSKLSGARITTNSISSSSGSTFVGLDISSVFAPVGYNNALTSATFDRCNLGGLTAQHCRMNINRSFIRSAATFDQNCSGSTIRNSIVAPGLGNSSNPISFLCSNVTISNCILGYIFADQPSVSISSSMIVTSHYSGKGAFSAAFKGSISNSLAVGYSSSTADRKTFLPDGGGNLNGFISSDVFLTTGSDDAKWQLKAGSPAVGAGYAGADAGAFGGGYVLSGILGRPRITRLVVPASATEATGLRFEVDAKSF
jgi:hypothetical protein